MGILRRYGKTSEEYERNRLPRLVEDIANLINSKAEFSYFNPDFGVKDLSSYTDLEQIANAAIDEIRKNIELYAKDVEIISITQQPSNTLSRINLLLECKVVNDLSKIKIFTDFGERKWRVIP
jgi:hypothetical protein